MLSWVATLTNAWSSRTVWWYRSLHGTLPNGSLPRRLTQLHALPATNEIRRKFWAEWRCTG